MFKMVKHKQLHSKKGGKAKLISDKMKMKVITTK